MYICMYTYIRNYIYVEIDIYHNLYAFIIFKRCALGYIFVLTTMGNCTEMHYSNCVHL